MALLWRVIGLGCVAFAAACAGDPPPDAAAPVRAGPPYAASAKHTSLTKEERSALEAELGVGVVKALEGNIPRPYSISGPRRGRTLGSVDVDYASLPVMTEVPLDTARDPVAFRLAESRAASPLCGEGQGYVAWSMIRPGVEPTLTHIGRFLLPRRDLATGALSSDLLDLDTLAAISVLPPGGAQTAWTALDDRGRSREAATMTRYEGTFDPSRRVGVAHRKLTVEAPSLTPGAIYAFRRCVAHCDEDLTSATREEEIEIIGPPAVWIGSSASTEQQRLPQGQPFTEISVRIAPSGSATLLLSVEENQLGQFQNPKDWKGDPSVARVMTFSLDVVWRVGHAPEATLFTGIQSGAVNEVVGGSTRSAFSPGCARL